MASVLVAYATKYGSTKEVAEAIGEVLRERGAEVDVMPARDAVTIGGYSAVVLGGALYYFHWLKDARRFLGKHRKALSALPVAVFGMGPLEDKAEDFEGARDQLTKALAKYPWLTPVAVGVFGGVLEPTKLRFPDNNPAMKNVPASDIRDWDAIKAWAAALPDSFGA